VAAEKRGRTFQAITAEGANIRDDGDTFPLPGGRFFYYHFKK
jgi:hypothetical protein